MNKEEFQWHIVTIEIMVKVYTILVTSVAISWSVIRFFMGGV